MSQMTASESRGISSSVSTGLSSRFLKYPPCTFKSPSCDPSKPSPSRSPLAQPREGSGHIGVVPPLKLQAGESLKLPEASSLKPQAAASAASLPIKVPVLKSRRNQIPLSFVARSCYFQLQASLVFFWSLTGCSVIDLT
ncbi:hypothetical protein C8R45DRAFT_1079144 [Mycena sanguinolenta]|nr:hypothetical protein C8R45DRAFT_1079144 [Mycena sanguinolenta]